MFYIMNRNFNIIHPQHTNNYTQAINVPFDSLDQIINHSADSIRCECLEYIDANNLDQFIDIVVSKVKPKGFVTFGIKNIKYYCAQFINTEISGIELLQQVNKIKNILSIEDIFTKIDMNTFVVTHVSDTDQNITITIERISI